MKSCQSFFFNEIPANAQPSQLPRGSCRRISIVFRDKSLHPQDTVVVAPVLCRPSGPSPSLAPVEVPVSDVKMWIGKRRKRGPQSPLSKDSTCFVNQQHHRGRSKSGNNPQPQPVRIATTTRHSTRRYLLTLSTNPKDNTNHPSPSHPDRTFQPPQPGPKSKSPAHTINPPLAREGTRKKGHRRQTNPLPAQPAGNRPAQTIQIDLASAAALGPAACATEEFGGGGACDRDLGSGRADPGPRRDLVSTHTCMSAHTPTELFSARSGLCGAGVCVFGGGRQAAECFRR